MKKAFHLTVEGKHELEAELEELKSRRAPAAERLKTARGFGDLAENAEYDAARRDLERIEGRISEIEHILQNSSLIKGTSSHSVVRLGSHVTLKNASRSQEFTIVGTVEADPLEGKISDESPIGKALMGKKVGDSVEIVTPAETTTFKIQTIK